MIKLFQKTKSIFETANFKLGDLFATIIAAFIAASIVFVIGGDFYSLLYVRMYSVGTFLLSMLAAFFVLIAAFIIFKTVKVVKISLYTLSLIFAIAIVMQKSNDLFLNIGIAFVLVLIIKYAVPVCDNLRHKDISKIASTFILVSAFVIYVVFVYICTSAKYKAFYHATYDFGIFAQMFEQMAKTGLPMTSVERGEWLSHFAVHFSPVFYLMLPGYYIFRTPLYLLAVQGIVTGLGAFPLRRICRSLGLSERISLIAAVIYLLYPTMSNGTFYDFHENKFLSVFILYLIWFILENKKIGIIICSALVLSVKEDAFIYVFAIAIWMIFTKRNRILAIIIAVVSVAYFFFACRMIVVCGGEIMSSRFTNYTPDKKGGLFDALKTCFVDIGYLINEVFSGADTESFSEITYSGQKLEFVLWTCTPLMFLPFLQKKTTNLILMIPMLVINLMPSWLYQSNIDYQYTYGSVALLIFMAVLALTQIPKKAHGFLIASMLAISIVFTVSVVAPKSARYLDDYYSNKEKCKETEELLKTIPKDSSVTAYGFMMPHLYYIDNLHTCPIYYGEYEQTDYYVIDVRYKKDEHTKNMISTMGDDYTLIADGGYVEIYQLTELLD